MSPSAAADIPIKFAMPHLPLAKHMPVTATAPAQTSYHWLNIGAPWMSTVNLQRPRSGDLLANVRYGKAQV